MDIFTTQLTRVAPNKIEPEKLKVKALAKEAKAHPVNDEIKELTEEEKRQKQSNQQQKQKHADSSALDDANEKVDGDQQNTDTKDGEIKHLDLYV